MLQSIEKKVTNSAAATRQLRNLILRGDLPGGTRLVEQKLCKELGVSRTPVREALQRLHDEGFVSAHGKRGFAVSDTSADQARSLYELIGLIERYVVSNTKAVPDTVIQEMEQLLASSEAESIEQYLELDKQFHDQFLSIADNEIACDLIRKLKVRAERYEWTYFQEKGMFKVSKTEHERVVSLLTANSFIEAGEAIETHWLNSLERLLTAME